MIQHTLINLHPNEYGQVLRYYPFAVNLDRCVGSCNTFNDLSDRLCVPGKTKDLNLNVFHMMARINKSKTNHASPNVSLLVVNVTQIKNGTIINVNVNVKTIKRAIKIIVGILVHVSVRMTNIDDSAIRCDEIINAQGTVSTTVTSTVSTNFYNKKSRCKMDCYILHSVLLVIILLFIIAIICYHYAKHRSKRKNKLLH